MNHHRVITPALDAETIALVEAFAAARGMTSEAYAAEAIRRAVESETDLDELVAAGKRSIARGGWIAQDNVMASLRTWRETRARPL